MSRSVVICVCVAVTVCLVGMGFISNASDLPEGAAAQPVAEAPPGGVGATAAAGAGVEGQGDVQPEWAVLALLLPGGLLIVLRPRRRAKQAAPPADS